MNSRAAVAIAALNPSAVFAHHCKGPHAGDPGCANLVSEDTNGAYDVFVHDPADPVDVIAETQESIITLALPSGIENSLVVKLSQAEDVLYR